ncbi:MAG: hypothetical protein ACPL1G_05885 [Thermodesulfovibrionales bacterium]
MKLRKRKFKETLPIESLLLRDRLGIKKYRKYAKRDPDKKEILLRLALKKIAEKEENDFISIGYRRRKICI